MWDIENKRVSAEAWAWFNMLVRCANVERDWHKRGITVCDRWQVFANFLADMGRRPGPEFSLDRKNNDGNYEPGNCRWATASEQMKNRRTWKKSEAEVAAWIATNRALALEGKGVWAKGLKRHWSPEAKERYRQKRWGQKEQGLGISSPAAREKLSQRKRAPVSDETKQKISAAQKGRKLSDAHVAALRGAYDGEAGQERRTKMTKVMTGRKVSDETRQKQSEAARVRWDRHRSSGE
jgi:hypothetical protein